VYLVWGSTFLGIKYAGETLPPLLMLAVRFGVAGPVLLCLTLRGGEARPTLAEWRSCAIVGSCLLCGGLGTVTLAEKHVPSGVAALMIGALPLWLAVLNRVWRGVRLRTAAVAGLAVGFAGVAILAWPSGSDAFDRAGIALLAVSPIIWALGSIYSLGAPVPARPLVAAACQMTAVVPVLLLAGGLHGEFGELGSVDPSWKSVVALVYLISFGSLLAYSAFVWLLSVAPVQLIGTYAFVNPIVALVLGRIFLGETISGRELVAAVVIVAAVALLVATPAVRREGAMAESPALAEP
jgi:drug/metabolite transporter (DMT)-like permease